MKAAITVVADCDARDHGVVVVKGTFEIDDAGKLALAAEQQPLVFADEHYGDPETTPVRLECEFAPQKPLTDVLVVGRAVAPKAVPVEMLTVRLEVEGRAKDVRVVGERRWVQGLGHVYPSAALPFVEMPLSFARAFGGSDDSRGPEQVAVEHRNLCGVGFHQHRDASAVAGSALPNLEDPRQLITSARDRPTPVGYGVIGRSWEQRARFVGTYDDAWRRGQAPYLPRDFDPLYYQCAPVDQRFPHFRGGERICCVNMGPDPIVDYVMPSISMMLRFRFFNRDVERRGTLDTVILEPHLRRAQLVWRASVPLGKKLTDLREVWVGPQVPDERLLVGYRDGRPVFRSLAAAVRWVRKLEAGQP